MSKRTLRSVIVSYASNAKAAILTPASGKQLRVQSVKLVNRSGSASDLGVLRLFGPDAWKLASVDAAIATDITAVVRAGVATALIGTTNNDGFLVTSAERFGLIGFTVAVGESGSPVYTYSYWNGSAYVAFTPISAPTAYATGDKVVLFACPPDWVPGSNITGADTTKYSILMKATTAPGTVVQVSAAWVARLVDFQPAVADKTAWQWVTATDELTYDFNAQDGVLPYFGNANAANLAACQHIVQD